jgi:hypothetical protein
MAWTDSDVARFFTAFESFWPGRLRPGDQDDQATRIWAEIAQRYSVAVAMGALAELFETSTSSHRPTPAAFRGIADGMQTYARERAKEDAERRALGPAISGVELANDEAFWEQVFDAARDEGDLERKKRIREHLRQGGSIVGMIAAAAGTKPRTTQGTHWLPPRRDREPSASLDPNAANLLRQHHADYLKAHRAQDRRFLTELRLRRSAHRLNKQDLAFLKHFESQEAQE